MDKIALGSVVRIRITEIPLGEAPPEIRQQWIGAEFSAYVTKGLAEGVVTHQPVVLPGEFGFRVEFDQAMDQLIVLGQIKALQWWRLHRGPNLLFDQNCCEIIG